MRLAIALLLVGDTALADVPSGTYRLSRAEQLATYRHGKKHPNGTRIPDCKQTESIAIPATLDIDYSQTSSIVIVNSEEWQRAGLTTDPEGKPTSFPGRVAWKISPPPRLQFIIWFRADGSNADGAMSVYELDDKDEVLCTVSYRFLGTHRP